ncbi:MAG TPA: hypothetical protein VH165_31500 [Kofleriaceae bacterium]|jgi:hypothetical protein|nr:hypothetical protein [Kofleriaceae bacterium]
MSDGTLSGDGKTLWTRSRGSSLFEQLDTPDNLTELAEEVAESARAASDERVKPYRTPVTPDSLRAPAE